MQVVGPRDSIPRTYNLSGPMWPITSSCLDYDLYEVGP